MGETATDLVRAFSLLLRYNIGISDADNRLPIWHRPQKRLEDRLKEAAEPTTMVGKRVQVVTAQRNTESLSACVSLPSRTASSQDATVSSGWRCSPLRLVRGMALRNPCAATATSSCSTKALALTWCRTPSLPELSPDRFTSTLPAWGGEK
jgi:hypothetical protein